MNDLSPRNQLRRQRISLASLAVSCVLTNLLLCPRALGQASTVEAPQPSSSSSYNSSTAGNSSQSNNPGAALSQTPYSGSVAEGKAMAGVLPLSFKDAIDRGLRNNLGLLLQSDVTLAARGQKWNELSALLPHVNASVTELAEQLDLAALGFRFNIPGIPRVIGPIGVFEAGTYLTQSVFDYHAIERNRAASYNE